MSCQRQNWCSSLLDFASRDYVFWEFLSFLKKCESWRRGWALEISRGAWLTPRPRFRWCSLSRAHAFAGARFRRRTLSKAHAFAYDRQRCCTATQDVGQNPWVSFKNRKTHVNQRHSWLIISWTGFLPDMRFSQGRRGRLVLLIYSIKFGG